MAVDSTNALSADYRIPIILGITGHRDLRPQDIPALKKVLEREFRTVKEDYPSSPIILLSPLAEGADRLAVRVALKEEINIPVIVPLPMPLTEYEKDFKQQSLDEFRALLAQADATFELPFVQGITLDGIRTDRPQRNIQYEQVGAYIARHCQILIALWDGVRSHKRAGTSTVVSFKLEGIPEPYVIPQGPLDQIENGMVYHIVTPRESYSTPDKEPYELVSYGPGRTTEQDVIEREKDILRKIDAYNADITDHLKHIEKKVKEQLDTIAATHNTELMPMEIEIQVRSTVASELAKIYQTERQGAIWGLYVLPVIALFAFQLYLEFSHYIAARGMLALYPAILALGLGYQWWANKKSHYHSKHIDYRAIAEGLNIQFYWLIAEMKEEVPDYYLRKQKGELDWIRQAIRYSTMLIKMKESGNCRRNDKWQERYRHWIQNVWIRGQKDYFKPKSQHNHNQSEKYEKRARYLYVIGILLTVMMFIFYNFLHENLHENYHHVAVVAVTMLLFLNSTLIGYSERLAHSELAKQYERMYHVYTVAEERLKERIDNGNQQEARKLIRELGREALAENGDWVLIHRKRPPELYN